MTHSDSWYSNFETLKIYLSENGHFPGKHTRLNNWSRCQRKRINAVIMPVEQKILFDEVAGSKSKEHTGGRRIPSKYVTMNLTNLRFTEYGV